MNKLWIGVLCAATLVGCGGSPPTSGDGGTDGGSTTDGGAAHPCGLADEPEPNETRDGAAPLQLGGSITGCLAADEDQDWFQFTAPSADLSGGYVTFHFGDVGNGTVSATLYTASDNGQVLSAYAANEGANLDLWLAVAPGQQYRVKIENKFLFKGAYKYTLTTTYTKIDDPFEPNDRKEEAKPLTLGTTVDAFVFSGHKIYSTPTDDDHADWYSMTLAGGQQVTIELANVPSNLTGRIAIIDSAGNELAYKYGSNAGANATLTRAAGQVTGGTYYVKVSKMFVFAGADPSGEGTSLPDHFTRKYHLTVTQP